MMTSLKTTCVGLGLCLLATTAASTAFAIGPYAVSQNRVLDLATGIEWQRYDDGTERTWEDGLAYCENLVLDGYTDWRLPNIRELDTLVDLSRYNPAIDPIFADTPFAHWSSTTYNSAPAEAWYVDFNSGMEVHTLKTTSNQCTIRCIRNGLVPLSIHVTGSGHGEVTIDPPGDTCSHVTCSQGYEYDTVVTLSAVPDGGSFFRGWAGEGCSGTGDCILTMDQAREVSATFIDPSVTAGTENAANVPVQNSWWLLLSVLAGAGLLLRRGSSQESS